MFKLDKFSVRLVFAATLTVIAHTAIAQSGPAKFPGIGRVATRQKLQHGILMYVPTLRVCQRDPALLQRGKIFGKLNVQAVTAPLVSQMKFLLRLQVAQPKMTLKLVA